MNYEYLILQAQESLDDDCTTCPYLRNCHNQCAEIQEHYNPNLRNH